MKTVVSRENKQVIIEDGQPTVLIGERINPTGRRKLAEAIHQGNYEVVIQEAIDQVEEGAKIVDVNVGIPDLDERILFPKIVKLLLESIEVPLCLDSADPVALKRVLDIYPGNALINSVTGQEKSLREILPLAKNYNAAIVGLTLDEKGVPADAKVRLEIAKKIVNQAESFGIVRDNIIIDCVAQSVGADIKAGSITLEAIRSIKTELGMNLIIGASNVSFGLPNRVLINAVLASMAVLAGVNCFIADVPKIRPFVSAADLLLGRDPYAQRYIQASKQSKLQI
jgi:5-methyltetrahydrofolate--homocysteine methyltransferase